MCRSIRPVSAFVHFHVPSTSFIYGKHSRHHCDAPPAWSDLFNQRHCSPGPPFNPPPRRFSLLRRCLVHPMKPCSRRLRGRCWPRLSNRHGPPTLPLTCHALAVAVVAASWRRRLCLYFLPAIPQSKLSVLSGSQSRQPCEPINSFAHENPPTDAIFLPDQPRRWGRAPMAPEGRAPACHLCHEKQFTSNANKAQTPGLTNIPEPFRAVSQNP